MATAETQASKERLLQDFNQVVADTEQLLKTVASAGGEKAMALKANVEQSLRQARQRLNELEEAAGERTRQAAAATDEYVRENPWQSVAVAAGIAAIAGVIVGLMLNRR
jgi:ElaB/YqjD/DUF883 family membrane-anchored ribosome-binding protein